MLGVGHVIALTSAFLVSATGTAQSRFGRLHPGEHGHANRRRRSVAHLGMSNSLLDHQIRICNAYAHQTDLEVQQESSGKTAKVTTSPIQYKSCTSMNLTLHNGDRLHFTEPDTEVSHGTFKVSSVPNSEAVLLLVLHRKSPGSNTMAFESHVFATVANAQVAVLDMYQGKKAAKVIIEEKDSGKVFRSENLKFNSVVAINAGDYQVVMEGEDGKTREVPLPAREQGNYIIMRVGAEEAKEPMDLMVFPQTTFKSAAATQAAQNVLAFCLGVSALQLWTITCMTSF